MKNKKGFTLVELLAVIAILAILVIIALPNVINMYNKAQKETFLTEAKKVYSEAEKKYISSSINGTTVKVINSEDSSKLDMTGEKLQYCVILNNIGKVSKMKVSNGKWVVNLVDDKTIDELTIDDLKDGNLDSDDCYNPFRDDSWSTIASNAKSCIDNEVNCPYKVGDTKTVDVGKYGIHTVRIANMSSSENEGCGNDNFSESSCGFVLKFADIITSHNMNSTWTNIGGWPATLMYKFLNDESDDNSIINNLEFELKNAIRTTKTISGHGESDSENFVSMDKLYLLATAEVWKNGYYKDSATSNTRQLDYYKNNNVTTSNYNAAIKYNNYEINYVSAGTAYWWRLRSAWSISDGLFCYVYKTGECSCNTGSPAIDANGVSPAFRIG